MDEDLAGKEPLRLSREDLYELAWSKPMSDLAKDFGISDVALAKRCRKLGIPVPGRGYWARIDAGQKPHRPTLPQREAQPGDSTPLTVAPGSAPSFESQYSHNEATDQPWLDEHLAYEKREANAIHVPAQTRSWHPVIAEWRDELQKASEKLFASKAAHERYEKWPQWRKQKEWDSDGYAWRQVEDRGQRLFDSHHSVAIRVSPGACERALKILNALAQAAEARGFTVHDDEEEGRIVFKGYGAALPLRLTEQLVEKTRPEKRYDGAIEQRRYKLPTGRLRITFGARYSEGPQFTDTDEPQLEKCLNRVFMGMYRLVVKSWRADRAQRKWQRQRDEEERRRKEQKEQEAARRAAIAAERRRRRRLLAESRHWTQARRLRSYVAHIRASAAESEVASPSELGTWLHWAGKVADELDPTAARLAGPPKR